MLSHIDPSIKRNKLFSLREIVNYPHTIFSTMGVILDATGTYKSNNSFDYVTKIRIIDNTFNPLVKKIENYTQYLTVFIYNQNLENAPVFKKVGDIILLKNFVFETNEFKEENYIIGKYKQSNSEWYVFDGKENQPIVPVSKSKHTASKLTEDELNRIVELRLWQVSLFRDNELSELQWLNNSQLPDKVINEAIYTLKDVDIIAKLLSKVKVVVNGLNYYKLAFVDKSRNIYFAEFQTKERDFEEGNIYKLRSVCLYLHNNNFKIDFYNYSAILQLQNYYRDSDIILSKTKDIKISQNELEMQFFQELHIEKYQKETIGHHTFLFTSMTSKSTKKKVKDLILNFPVLKKYDLSEAEIPGAYQSTKPSKYKFTIIQNDCKDMKIIPISQLNQMIVECQKNKEAFENYKKQFYRVQGNVSDIESTNIDQICKFVSLSKNQQWAFTNKEVAQISGHDIQVIFDFYIKVQDKSCKNTTDSLALYLLTYDQNKGNFFELWGSMPSYDDIEKWVQMNLKEKERFKENLLKVKSNKYEIDAIVQLNKKEDQNIYLFKIVKTMAWFMPQ